MKRLLLVFLLSGCTAEEAMHHYHLQSPQDAQREQERQRAELESLSPCRRGCLITNGDCRAHEFTSSDVLLCDNAFRDCLKQCESPQ